ncbi:hypothetical protein G7Z17_g2779 [Cylindrodendrum hubeiense]|uniref:Zn(2)-C6 fungal-type domain-containing protein n=1 Tax=Cylindrodendrum hubeiense TaxID=595255 RepID=A0A9P5HC30_9HYPO|nr:hypothetical protein G7Z17_g2779 [Cylindrodendrum hubeiense]
MPRRSHRKSRNGCFECKRRHIRCDEQRPECSHCSRAERECSFPKPKYFLIASLPGQAESAPATEEIDDQSSATSEENESQILSHNSELTFSLIHMTFLHHAENYMGEYVGLQGQMKPMIDIAIDNASAAPYLLDQLLALSALHLSTTDTSRSSLYHYQATELQTRALGVFDLVKNGISSSNCLPPFVFASLLGIHVLKETFSHNKSDLDAFINSFINYSRLHRGVRAITDKFWAFIIQSDMKHLLYIGDLSEEIERQTPGTETNELCDLLKSLDSESASIQACQKALEKMQSMLDICKLHPTRIDVGAQAAMAWPLIVPTEYFDALYQHQPEALVIFAYYAAMLHRNRQFWVFGDTGVSIFDMVSNNLGNFWEKSLTWPAQVLKES